MGIEPTHARATIWCVNHFTTPAIFLYTGSRNWTHTEGFGDLSSTFKLCPYKMEGEGFEPPNPKERIYSPPRLASSLPFLIIELMARDGIEPPTHGASIHCSTNWATEPYCGSRIWTYDLRVMSPTSYLAAPSRVNYKEDVGFEPTHAFTRLTVFKTVPFSRTWVILQIL